MKKQIQHMERLHRLVWFVTWAVLICLLAVAMALAAAIGTGKPEAIAAYAAAGGPLLAALSVALIADRQIKNDDVRKQYERDLIVVQSMHQVIFLAEDMKDLAAYITRSFTRTDVRAPLALLGHHERIQQRFAEICGGHIYNWIEGESLLKLHALRGSIYGMCLALSEKERDARAKGHTVIPHIQDMAPFESAIADLEAFIESVRRARLEIDQPR